VEIREGVARHQRPAVFLYAGDFDASGEDISRDFMEKTEDLWQEARRIARAPSTTRTSILT
jgi:hypothetical protein